MSVQITIPAETSHLALVGVLLQQCCPQARQLVLLELAVGEILVNAIRHGGAQRIRLCVTNQADAYDISILDNGIAFNPLLASRASMGELREGGYGLPIIHSVAQNLKYSHHLGWNCVQMRFAREEVQYVAS